VADSDTPAPVPAAPGWGWAPGSTPGGGWVPVPDPTTLTTAQLRRELDQATGEIRREIEAVRLLLATRLNAEIESTAVRVASLQKDIDGQPARRKADLDALQELVESRLGALENKLRLTFEEVRTIPAETRMEISHLRELHEEKFHGIELQFAERDTRGDQEKKASKEALDAALLAQKESVAQQNDANTTAATKSETSFTKQIDQIGTLIATLEKSLTDRITELKERIDRGEGSNAGALSGRTERRLDIGQLVAVIAVLLAAISIAAFLLKK
jgi:hypothetical protein